MPTLIPHIRHLKTVVLLTDYTQRIYWVGKPLADQSCRMCVFPARCYHPMVTPGISIWADTSQEQSIPWGFYPGSPGLILKSVWKLDGKLS